MAKQWNVGDHIFYIARECELTKQKAIWSDVTWPCILYCDRSQRECEYYIAEYIIGNQCAADAHNKSTSGYRTREEAETALGKYKTKSRITHKLIL